MKTVGFWPRIVMAALLGATITAPSYANAFREHGKPAAVAASSMIVTPPRDWNQLSLKPGKVAETWTLDGEQLNNVTFFGGVAPGQPLFRERSKKRDPLPKFASNMLLAEVPEMLERTYRTYNQIADFKLSSSEPDRFLGRDGLRFTYEYLDQDDLPRRGEARAIVVGGKLYMVTFDAPRIYYFEKSIDDFRRLTDSASLSKG